LFTPKVSVKVIPAIHTKIDLLTSIVDLVKDLEYFATITPNKLYIAIVKNTIMTVARSTGLVVIYLSHTLKCYTTATPESLMTQASCFKKQEAFAKMGSKMMLIMFP